MENQAKTLLKVNDIHLEIEGWSISEDLYSQYNMVSINGQITNEYIELSNKVKAYPKVEKISIEDSKLLFSIENASFNSLSISSHYEDNMIGNFSMSIQYNKLMISIKK